MSWKIILQYRWRRLIAVIGAAAAAIGLVVASPQSYESVLDQTDHTVSAETSAEGERALEVLARLEIKSPEAAALWQISAYPKQTATPNLHR